jgi:uncharacterized protein YbjT (DUF2867 family)
MKVLVTGATGYIGGRLVPRLLERGHDVRCVSRDPAQLTLDPWRDQVEVVAADALEAHTLDAALDGCDAAYFLIHAMKGSPKSFAEQGSRAAANFRDAADRAGLRQIVYLGGLGSDDDQLSEHLASRQEVGRVLAMGDTPVVELRAAVIIGSGSMSFEMVRHLTEVLPVMMTPRWVETRCQPIAVRNVLEILISVLDSPNPRDTIYEIGGPDILTYQQMMEIYADVAGLKKRLVIPLPLFSDKLSAPFVGLVTPLPIEVARPLIDSVRNDVVVTRSSPPGFDPQTLLPYREALQAALYSISRADVETRWSDALTAPGAPLPGDPVWSGALMQTNQQVVESSATQDELFWAATRIGGDVGYYAMNWAWTIRGWIDQLIGGVGLRRGRRHPEELRPGESLDFFRVAEIDPATTRLLLQAEMKVPGTAWLEWLAERTDQGSRLTQTAWFVPRGLLGRLYWWVLLPFHAPIWRLMARRMARTAEQRRGSH